MVPDAEASSSAVQWHPEDLVEHDPAARKLFSALVAAARRSLQAQLPARGRVSGAVLAHARLLGQLLRWDSTDMAATGWSASGTSA